MPAYTRSLLNGTAIVPTGPTYSRALLTGTTYGIDEASDTLGRLQVVNGIDEVGLGLSLSTLVNEAIVPTGPTYSRALLTGTTYGIDEASDTLGRLHVDKACGEEAAAETVELAGASAGASATAAVLQVTRNLAAASAGTSTVSGALRTGVKLASVSSGTSTIAASLAVTRGLAGFSAGNSTATGALYVVPGLAGRSSGICLVSGTLFIPIHRRISSDGGAAQPARLFGAAPTGTPRMFDEAPATGARRIFKQ